MIAKTSLIIYSTVVLLLILGGCRGFHGAPERPPLEIPATFSSTGKTSPTNRWWQEFNDPIMWKMVETSLTNNFTVRSAYERIKMANAIAQKARAPLFPWLDVGAGVSHQTQKEGGEYFNHDTISVNSAVNYELDLWGRIASKAKAAQLDVKAQEADYQAALLSLSAQVVSRYFEVVALKQEKKYIESQIERNNASLKIIDEKYRFGQSDSLDLLQQKQLVEQNISNKIAVDKALASSIKELLVLMGRAPSSNFKLESALQLPNLPPLPATGLPLEILTRRPDCMRAFLRLKAANARLAEAVSAQYPRLALSGNIESDSSALKDLLENWIASIGANLLIPVFEGGRLDAEVKLKEAEAKRLLYEYGQTILLAIREIEESLDEEKRQMMLIENLTSRLKLARHNALVLKEKYLAGDVEYLRFLTSQLSVDELERQLVKERLHLIQNRIRLYKAIAGPLQPLDGESFTKSPEFTR